MPEDEREEPSQLTIILRRNRIRASWDQDTEQRRKGLAGKRIARILLQVVDTTELINCGWLDPSYDPGDW